ncbi:amidase [Streptomyces triticirhizae]|uniref:Indole acetimide hydrolase n=1 Tax=Streptomyces triticirhizae TaxID=2483353 RepID=A0A3M2LM83_9ACTN|nr:amidase [Streptomyces triticirhizae]RMI37930.1 indole acetimide hydrolase [Streptomyces triticirhizae]
MDDTGLWQRTAGELGAAVGRGERSAVEVVESHLARIAEVNPTVNAVTQLLAERALAEAASLDARRAAGERLGPLAGVPFTVKENLGIAGVPTTHGVARFRESTARVDAPPVARLRAAGAIPVGHSNMPDLTLGGVHPRSELFGETANPWDAGRTPGGTSGGDGAAVSSGMVPLGLGNDSGGSVRVPAAFCGVVGLKPSGGRYPADHRIGADDPPLASQLIPVDGPLARTVGDLRLAHAALAGADPRDPRAVPVPVEGPTPPTPWRIAVVRDPGGQGTHPAVDAAVTVAADALADAGHAVEEIADVPRLAEALEVYGGLIMTEFAQGWQYIEPVLPQESRAYIRMSMERNTPVGLAGYLRLTGRWLGLRRSWAELMDRYQLLLGPVFTEPPVEPGLESSGPAGFERVSRALRLCAAVSLVGLPAVALPGAVVDGLPQGVQLVGPMYREDLCLAGAEVVQRRTGVLTPVQPAPRR